MRPSDRKALAQLHRLGGRLPPGNSGEQPALGGQHARRRPRLLRYLVGSLLVSQLTPTSAVKYVAETKPTYLYFGCAEAQVAANELLGMRSGEVFVHRNLGNQVLATDVNALAVLEYAVDTLDVKDILVTGHYDCSVVKAAMGDFNLAGSVEYWFRPLRDVYRLHEEEL